MAFAAPMAGHITGRILHLSYADIIHFKHLLFGKAGGAGVRFGSNGMPV